MSGLRHERIVKLGFLVLATPVVVRAALRVRRLQYQLELPDLVDTLRDVRPIRTGVLSDPLLLQWSVGVILRWLPPYGMGSCLKRSYLLLDVLSRCGQQPKFHLGLVGQRIEHRVHAWVTTGPGSQVGEVYDEIWSY